MADESKKAILSSLKELKDSDGGGAAPAEGGDKPAQKSAPQSSLLSSLLDDIKSEAEEEKSSIEAQLRAKEEAERKAKEEEEARTRDVLKRKLEEETRKRNELLKKAKKEKDREFRQQMREDSQFNQMSVGTGKRKSPLLSVGIPSLIIILLLGAALGFILLKPQDKGENIIAFANSLESGKEYVLAKALGQDRLLSMKDMQTKVDEFKEKNKGKLTLIDDLKAEITKTEEGIKKVNEDIEDWKNPKKGKTTKKKTKKNVL